MLDHHLRAHGINHARSPNCGSSRIVYAEVCAARRRRRASRSDPISPLGGLPNDMIVHLVLFIVGIMLDEEVPCNLRWVLSSGASCGSVSGFDEEDRIVGAGEIGCQWTAAWTGTYNDVVIGILSESRCKDG